MSKMRELYKKVSADEALQEIFYSLLEEAETLGEKATKEKIVHFAKAQGYDITIEEMQAFFSDLAEKEQTELSAAELDMVAGGKGNTGIVLSAMSLGFGCAVWSVVQMFKAGAESCRQLLNGDTEITPKK